MDASGNPFVPFFCWCILSDIQSGAGMSIIKIAIAALISILPINMMRVSAYRIFLGYEVRDTRIGFGTVIAVEKASIQSCNLGVFNLFMGPMKIMIGNGASIGNQNTF